MTWCADFSPHRRSYPTVPKMNYHRIQTSSEETFTTNVTWRFEGHETIRRIATASSSSRPRRLLETTGWLISMERSSLNQLIRKQNSHPSIHTGAKRNWRRLLSSFRSKPVIAQRLSNMKSTPVMDFPTRQHGRLHSVFDLTVWSRSRASKKRTHGIVIHPSGFRSSSDPLSPQQQNN